MLAYLTIHEFKRLIMIIAFNKTLHKYTDALINFIIIQLKNKLCINTSVHVVTYIYSSMTSYMYKR